MVMRILPFKKYILAWQNIISVSYTHLDVYKRQHENHGLGIYKGIEKITVDKVAKDYIKIEYAGNSTLYILPNQLDLLQKYAGADARAPKLNKIGGQEWNKTKTKVRKAVKNIAKDLVRLYACLLYTSRTEAWCN